MFCREGESRHPTSDASFENGGETGGDRVPTPSDFS